MDICKIHEIERWMQEKTSRHGLLGKGWEECKGVPYPFNYFWHRWDRSTLVCCLWYRPGMMFLRELVLNSPYQGYWKDHEMARSKLDDALSKIGGNGVIAEKAFDEEFSALYPTVHVLFTETEKGKGKKRIPCTIVLYTANGLYNVIITEKELEVKLFASGASMEEMWQCLEERVSSPNPDWVKDTKKKY